jgi:uncharacterized protein (DUF2147 family)
MRPIATRLLKPVSFANDVANARSRRSCDTVSGKCFEHDQLSAGASPRASIRLMVSCRAATIIGFGLLAPPAFANGTPSPIGTWATANGHGVVEIATCGSALCGWIVGIQRGPADAIPTDVHGRSQCGLAILSDEQPAKDGSWLGVVTDPRDGGTYQAKLWIDASGDLNLRGFIGIPQLGSTQTWHRFTGHLTMECRLL